MDSEEHRWEGMTLDSYFGESVATGGSFATDNGLSTHGHWILLWKRFKSGVVVSSVNETADALLRVKRRLVDAAKWRACANSDDSAGLRQPRGEAPFSNRAVTRPRGYP